MKKEDKVLIKYVLADILDEKIIKSVFLYDAYRGFALIKNKKHIGKKDIKRRNRKHETIYKEQLRRIHLWNDVLQFQQQRDLFMVDDEDIDEELIETAKRTAHEMVSYKVSLKFNDDGTVTAKRDNWKVGANTYITKELEKIDELKKLKRRRIENESRQRRNCSRNGSGNDGSSEDGTC